MAATAAAAPDILRTWPLADWDAHVGSDRDQARRGLEEGDVLYFPHLAFALEPGEGRFLTGASADEGAKNIALRPGAAAIADRSQSPVGVLERLVGRPLTGGAASTFEGAA
ncbi:MAG: Kdo hydroxylase family protein [Methylobacteriaceae bacterium]|nr:Kdo hydroxylase family protein [Methylobacteriaceae bacterium]